MACCNDTDNDFDHVIGMHLDIGFSLKDIESTGMPDEIESKCELKVRYFPKHFNIIHLLTEAC